MIFSLPHAEIMTQLGDIWAMLNINGIPAAMITLVCGYLIFRIFSGMFAREDD